MKAQRGIIGLLMMVAMLTPVTTFASKPLKKALKKEFLIGAAINDKHVRKNDDVAKLAAEQFNSIVAENCMKSEAIHPEEGRWNFKESDRFVAYGNTHGMAVIGHTLVWHSQLAPWFCYDSEGKYVTPEVMKARLKEHITTIVSRYKGKIYGWDVVNEVIGDDGDYRKSPFYEILGKEYIKLAFEYAAAADPDAELYYNDYALENSPAKRAKAIEMVKWLQSEGIKIDAVGIQAHIGMDYPTLEEMETTINEISALGVKVMITELDLSAIPTVHMSADVCDLIPYDAAYDPFKDGLVGEKKTEWDNRMAEFFRLFLQHKKEISRVTVWGVVDSDSWKNDFPMQGRTDYPLLFDRKCQPKKIVNQLTSGELKKRK